MNKMSVLLLLLVSCGINVHVDPIKTDPIKVEHTVTIDYNLVNTYCTSKCAATSSDPTVVDSCTNDCFRNFIDVLTHVTGGIR